MPLLEVVCHWAGGGGVKTFKKEVLKCLAILKK